MSEKPFSIPEIEVWLDEHQFIMASDLISTAATLFGDGQGEELGRNPEYERGIAELITRFMNWPVDQIPNVIRAIHGTARDNSHA